MIRLDSRIQGMDYSLSYGSGSLKALQNDNLPEIDLLVREAIQNSSDASLREPGEMFGVNFNYRTFRVKDFNGLLSDVSELLDEKYQDDMADYLEIRDYKTAGLTGCVRISEVAQNMEDHGNYFKLVFDTGKEQTNSDDGMAGGSWGYGKSVYFRVGMGLVVFYSRIRVDGGFESRLIVSLIEHENSKDAILPKIKHDSVGKAWWGRKDENNPSEILPITDENEIKEILNIFGTKPFDEDETGTSIIIPYIDKNRLLEGIFPEHCGISDEVIAMCSFKDDIEQYTQLAIQKWYAPKIFNKNLSKYSNQKWLAVRVNDKAIRDIDMRPLFQLIQELYTSALSANKHGNQEYSSNKYPGIKTICIPSKKVQGDKAGYAATIVIKKEALGSAGTVIPPRAYLRLFGALTNNDPVVMYARAAGMVLDYKIDGMWTKRMIKPESEDELMFTFFVPNCSLPLKNDLGLGVYAGISLGDYLRKCEKSDHMSWNDPSSLTVVTNMAAQTTAKVNEYYKPKNSSDSDGTVSRLSGKLGKRLLPTLNFGIKKGGSGGNGSGGSGGAVNNLELKLFQSAILCDSMAIEFEMIFKNTRKEAFVGVFVESEVGLMNAETWHTGIGTAFPIKISSINKCSTYAINSDKDFEFPGECNADNYQISNGVSSIKIIYSNAGDALGFRVENDITNAIVKGTITLKSSDKKYCCTIKEAKEFSK